MGSNGIFFRKLALTLDQMPVDMGFLILLEVGSVLTNSVLQLFVCTVVWKTLKVVAQTNFPTTVCAKTSIAKDT